MSTSIKRSVAGDPLLLRGRGPTIALLQLRTHIRPKSLVMKFFSVRYGIEPPYNAASCEGVHSQMFDSRRTSYNIWKRSLDVAVSVFLLLILGPLMLLLALLVYIRLGSPVLYRQTRPGLHGKPFLMYKFRTMTDDRNDAGSLLPDEERLTSFGRILRRYSLDELPEMIKVLRGEMSIVGPRPLLMEYLGRYTMEQMRRHDVRPGLTGWAQVNGRNAISWEEKFELDIWYVDRQSLRLDVKIIFMTLMKVLKGEGISQQGHATMEYFMGSREKSDNGRIQ